MIRGVALDLEGTVVNVEPAHHQGWIRAAEEIGIHFADPEEAIEKISHFLGGPDSPIIEEIFALLPGAPMPTETQTIAFLSSKWRHYDQLLAATDLSPRPGFLEVYGKFRCLGIPVTIGTAVDLERGLSLLKHSGLAKLFRLHEIVLVTDVKHPKPSPDCFLETAARMGISPCEQLVFEDSPRGVRSGVAAGSYVVGMPVYDNETAKNKLLEAGAVKIFGSWREINVNQLLQDLATGSNTGG